MACTQSVKMGRWRLHLLGGKRRRVGRAISFRYVIPSRSEPRREQRAQEYDKQHKRPDIPILEPVGVEQFAPGLALNQSAKAKFKAQREAEPHAANHQERPDLCGAEPWCRDIGREQNKQHEQTATGQQRPGSAQTGNQYELPQATVQECQHQDHQPETKCAGVGYAEGVC